MTSEEYKKLSLKEFDRAVEKFFMSLHRVLRPAANRVWRKGDVHVYSRADIQRLCDESGLKLELYEVRKGFRLHCVVRKPDCV